MQHPHTHKPLSHLPPKFVAMPISTPFPIHWHSVYTLTSVCSCSYVAVRPMFSRILSFDLILEDVVRQLLFTLELCTVLAVSETHTSYPPWLRFHTDAILQRAVVFRRRSASQPLIRRNNYALSSCRAVVCRRCACVRSYLHVRSWI